MIVPSSESFESKVRFPVLIPTVVVFNPISKVVELPAASIVLPKGVTKVNPAGTDKFDISKSAVPVLFIVKVLVTVEF